MKQFSLNRFGKLALWSLTMDRQFYRKQFLQLLVMAVLMVMMFTVYMGDSHPNGHGYDMCAFVVIVGLIGFTVLGPTYMFYSMSGKHDRQTLMLLPASNLEKYVMRYVQGLLLLPLAVIAFLIADGLQYMVNLLMGHEWVHTIAGYLVDSDNTTVFGPNPRHTLLAISMLLLWIHSIYAVGATFFRSHKHNWVLTSVVLIAGSVLLHGLYGWVNVNCLWWNNVGVFNVLFLCLAVFNFWLSFRLFCRQQVIGKFVNL